MTRSTANFLSWNQSLKLKCDFKNVWSKDGDVRIPRGGGGGAGFCSYRFVLFCFCSCLFVFLLLFVLSVCLVLFVNCFV